MSVQVGEARVDCLSPRETVDAVCDLAAAPGGPHLVVTPNIHHVAEMEHNEEFRSAAASAALSLPDGWPIVVIARLRGCRGQGRVTGSDLVEPLCREAHARGLSVGFVGGQPGSAESAARILARSVPGLRVAMTYCPPMGFDRDAAATRNLLGRVEASRPDILFLAVGAPKSEVFTARHRPAAGVVVCVGASLDFISGALRRAPKPAQALGLEWAYRALTEPRRLLPRYARAAVGMARILVREGPRGGRKAGGHP